MVASIVICTYNRAKLLKRLLMSLQYQTIPSHHFEIVLIDDGSTDETPQVCRHFITVFPNVSYIRNGKNLGLTKARNAGISTASTDKILFTDDDCIPAKDWIEKTCVALEAHPIIAGAVGSPSFSFMQTCLNIAGFHQFLPGRKRRYTKFIAGANMAFQRDALKKLGGFRGTLRCAEDMDLALRAVKEKSTILFEPDSNVMHHHVRKRFKSVFSYYVYHGSKSIILRQRYRHFMWTPFVLQSPLLLILGAPMIALMVTMEIYLRNPRLARLLHTAPLVYILKLAWCWGAARGLAGEETDE